METTQIKSGQSLYPARVKEVFLSADKGKVAGKLLPTNEIFVEELGPELIKFKIKGYSQKKSPNIIYFKEGLRIISISFAKAQMPEITTLKEGEGSEAYDEVELSAWTDFADFSMDLKGLFAYAKTTYDENCSMCHSLHAESHYNAAQWPNLFKSMVGRTGIDKDDIYLVTQYLQKHSSDIK